jgi:PUB domain
MQNFLDRFKPSTGNGKNNSSGSSNNNNPLANLFGGGAPKAFAGQGQSLGGNNQPGQVIPIVLSDPGPLGIQLEKRSDRKTAIVGSIVVGSQAEAAGLQRGDILCFAGSLGREEILYEMFLELAKSSQRPICLEVRRITPVKSQPSYSKNADDFTRRQAVIAAAELREKEHKKKQKPMAKTTTTDTSKLLQSAAEKARLGQEQRERHELQQQQPLSAATLEAQALAKASEAQTAREFGYNPYESKSMTAGQARNAVVTTTHGSIVENTGTTTTVSPPNRVNAPVDPAADIPETVQMAFETMVTSSNNAEESMIVDSLKILKTLIANATTKGQLAGQDKFRTVRLENAKIKAAVVDIVGAMDVLLECGFQLTHEDDDAADDGAVAAVASHESILVYPIRTNIPSWIVTFLRQIEQYVQNSSL